MSQEHERQWWKEAVIYQIYPASFKDSNNDGIGDIPGIISKLPYLAFLGVSCLWISPHYASPQVDVGYDIEDYEDIYPPFGTLSDCQQLIDQTHAHGMKIIFDLVINHTSDLHAWFKESRSSKTNPKRDWYFWRPPRYDEKGVRCAPNNWRSQFSVPAWTFDELTQEYYLHLYAPEMPDLNWENIETRQAIYKSSMKFWLERGIDGFRIDTVNKYSKDTSFPDVVVSDPASYTQPAMSHYSNGPRMKEFLHEMRDVFDSYQTADGGRIVTVGELPNTPLEKDVLAYVSAKERQLDMVFNFDVVSLGQTPGDRLVPKAFTKSEFKVQMSRWQTFVNETDAWTTVFLENHDQGRCISRFGSDQTVESREKSGAMLAMILASMTGTLFIYQGQEIGSLNMPKTWGEAEYKDIRSVNFLVEARRKGGDAAVAEALEGMRKAARDNARTPMLWDDGPNAGFCGQGAKPWMRVHDQYRNINVKKQLAEDGSLLRFWKRLLGLKKQYKDLFVYGKFDLMDSDDNMFVFTKTHGGQRSITVANMSSKLKKMDAVAFGIAPTASLLVGNTSQGSEDILGGYEARIYLAETQRR